MGVATPDSFLAEFESCLVHGPVRFRDSSDGKIRILHSSLKIYAMQKLRVRGNITSEGKYIRGIVYTTRDND